MSALGVEALIAAAESGRTFEINDKNEIHPLPFLSRLWRCRDVHFHQARIQKIAEAFSYHLAHAPRMAPVEADRSPLVQAAKKWLKSGLAAASPNAKIHDCARELLAVRLGIASEVFDTNPGFEQFAKKAVLYNYLIRYQHALQVGENKELLILHQNRLQAWNTIHPFISDAPPSNGRTKLPWIYGREGIQKKDLYEWAQLEPFIKGDPQAWGNQYGIEFCTCCVDHPRLTGDHSWIRLYTPDGDIYSHGLYLPGKGDKKEMFNAPLRLKRGECQSPDVSEFWNVPVQTLFIGIDKEQFIQIKEKIESKKQSREEVFHLFALNCLMDVNNLGAIAGIYLPTEASVLYVYAPASLKRFMDRCSQILPKIIQKICLLVGSVFFNLVQVYFGAGKVDSQIKKFNCKYRPHIETWKDIFNPRKLNLHAPFYFATVVRQCIHDWRKKKLQRVLLNEEKKAKFAYGIPKKYRIPATGAAKNT